MASGLGQVDPGAPRVRGVEAEADPSRRDAARGERLGDAGQLVDGRCRGRTRRRPSSRARSIGPSASAVDLGEDQREPVGQPLRCPPRTPRPAMRPDVDVDEPAAEPGRRPQVAGQDPDGAAEEVLLGPARLTRYEAWIATGAMSSSVEALAEGAAARSGGSARRRQAVGLSAKIWIALAPISCARSTALTIPAPSGRWAPRRRPSEASRHRTMPAPWLTTRPARAAPRAPDPVGRRRLAVDVAKVLRAFFRDDRL